MWQLIILRLLFYLALLGLFYTYIGYLLWMFFLIKLGKDKPINKSQITPRISIVISAYNEENSIKEKLENILNVDYPKSKMEILVASDASSDRTDELVKDFKDKGVKLYRLKKRSGKIGAYRGVFPKLNGEIVVFTDATSILNKDSITHLINNFNDGTVGCVGGLLRYVNPNEAMVGEGESRYWQYENKIREYESRLCSLPSVSGTLYAVRKELYPYNMKDYLADDLIVPINVKKAGFRTILEDKAVCKESTTLSIKEEMAKRIRITVQNIRGLIEEYKILNPFKYGLFSLLVISHKLFRLMSPLFLLCLLLSNLILALHSQVYLSILIFQVLFYLVGLGGYLLNKKSSFKLLNFLFYFCLSNLTILVGIAKFFRGEKVITWEPTRANFQEK